MAQRTLSTSGWLQNSRGSISSSCLASAGLPNSSQPCAARRRWLSGGCSGAIMFGPTVIGLSRRNRGPVLHYRRPAFFIFARPEFHGRFVVLNMAVRGVAVQLAADAPGDIAQVQ